MNGEATGDWLFYAPKEHLDWPTGLGYFIAYKIVESLYRNAPDEEQALLDILQVTDYKGLVDRPLPGRAWLHSEYARMVASGQSARPCGFNFGWSARIDL